MRRDRATTFSTPFLSLISRSNSCKRSTDLIKSGLVSCFVSKYLRTIWLMNTMTLAPTKYDLNLSKAKIIVSNSFSVVV